MLFSDLKFTLSKIEAQALPVVPEGEGKGAVHYSRIPEPSYSFIHMDPCVPYQIDAFNRNIEKSLHNALCIRVKASTARDKDLFWPDGNVILTAKRMECILDTCTKEGKEGFNFLSILVFLMIMGLFI